VRLISYSGRQPYYYNNALVYEWEQALEEVYIYIKAPEIILPKNRETVKKNLAPGQVLPKLEVDFQPKNLKIGIKGNNHPYINVSYVPQIGRASRSNYSQRKFLDA
jgi:hypothetical protein